MNAAKKFETEFVRHSSKRVRQLKSTFKEIVHRLDGEAIHDFRKATRELQTIVDAIGIRRPSRPVTKIIHRLRRSRHALSEWRDSDVLLTELKKARRKARTKEERRCWAEIAERIAKQRRRALKKFSRKHKSLKVKATGNKAKALIKEKVKSEPMMDNLRRLLERSWNKWTGAIDEFVSKAAAPELHEVRIKTKTLRYAIELSQKFYPDRELETASEWLKGIQDRVGAWHDELMLGRVALETFSETPRDPSAIKVIRDTKEKEIALAESSRNYILSIRKMKNYQRLKRVLSASVYAMTDGRGPRDLESESITGPIQ
ncbi:MAG: CHAD domain-containing protein [Candidatus Binatus sp.]|uniref:CHAD domain-containing protein n=1 Tax=Candidatus Binatus sp. TaxID=2811406 RepID=UPI003BB1C2B3